MNMQGSSRETAHRQRTVETQFDNHREQCAKKERFGKARAWTQGGTAGCFLGAPGEPLCATGYSVAGHIIKTSCTSM